MSYFDLSREEAVDAAPAVVALHRRLDVDLRPLEAYGALRGDYSFLLESAEKDVSALRQVTDGDGVDGRARYSFLGFEPDAVVRVNRRRVDVELLRSGAALGDLSTAVEDGEVREGRDTLDALRAAFPDVQPRNFRQGERQVFSGGLVGALAYDAVHDVWLEGTDHPGETDDAVFVLSTRNLVFDHDRDEVTLVFTPVLTSDGPVDPADAYDAAEQDARRAEERLGEHEPREPGRFEVLEERAGERRAYESAVEKAREHVHAGDVYQAVVSRSREMEVQGDPRDFYRELREVNPSPYMYLLEFSELAVVGSSPETLLSVHDRRVSTNPIAGTCGRGETAVEDRRLAGEMLSDEKELSEHVMLVDLGRNDVRRVSAPNSVVVDDFMSVVQYSHVQHIESTVSGELRDGSHGETGALDAFDATRAIFPAGTLSGAPKIRAMEIIDELERRPRGYYGGGVGYYSWTGDSDFAITIRTATFEDLGDSRSMKVQAGAGIVADSRPDAEFDETEDKMDALLTALDGLRTDGETTGRDTPSAGREGEP